MADNPFAHQFDNLQPFTKEDVERNLQVIDEILHLPMTLEMLHDEIITTQKMIDILSEKLAPLIALAGAIPEAMESNPMMKMLLGRMSK
jgi:hypothetical protein